VDGCDTELVLLIVRVISVHGASLGFSGILFGRMVKVFSRRKGIAGSSEVFKGSLNGPLATVVRPHGGVDDLSVRVIIIVRVVGSSSFIISLLRRISRVG
jgi:hypothetical protein